MGFAVKGAVKLITTEHSIMVQSSIALFLVFAGFYFKISREEWMLQILASGLVLSIEGLNTAIEKIADFIHPEYHKKLVLLKILLRDLYFCCNYCPTNWFDNIYSQVYLNLLFKSKILKIKHGKNH